jgi:hypothetical protein
MDRRWTTKDANPKSQMDRYGLSMNAMLFLWHLTLLLSAHLTAI